MGSELLLKTPLGKLELETGNWFENRTITFEKTALTILGINISTLEYQLVLQTSQPPDIVRSFEKDLLDGPHSFGREDVKEIADKINRNKNSFGFGGFHIVFDDSASTWSIKVTPSCEHRDKEFLKFELLINRDKRKRHLWEITVDADDDIWVSALVYVCLAAKHIHEEEEFINTMYMVHG